MKYGIVVNSNINEFVSGCHRRVQEGEVPQGGMTMTTIDVDTIVYGQSFLSKEDCVKSTCEHEFAAFPVEGGVGEAEVRCIKCGKKS